MRSYFYVVDIHTVRGKGYYGKICGVVNATSLGFAKEIVSKEYGTSEEMDYEFNIDLIDSKKGIRFEEDCTE